MTLFGGGAPGGIPGGGIPGGAPGIPGGIIPGGIPGMPCGCDGGSWPIISPIVRISAMKSSASGMSTSLATRMKIEGCAHGGAAFDICISISAAFSRLDW
jgi:hypothetical protein